MRQRSAARRGSCIAVERASNDAAAEGEHGLRRGRGRGQREHPQGSVGKTDCFAREAEGVLWGGGRRRFGDQWQLFIAAGARARSTAKPSGLRGIIFASCFAFSGGLAAAAPEHWKVESAFGQLLRQVPLGDGGLEDLWQRAGGREWCLHGANRPRRTRVRGRRGARRGRRATRCKTTAMIIQNAGRPSGFMCRRLPHA